MRRCLLKEDLNNSLGCCHSGPTTRADDLGATDLGDAEHNSKRTRREVFLVEMDRVVPWKKPVGANRAALSKVGQSGRQQHQLDTMLHIHCFAAVVRIERSICGRSPVRRGVRCAVL
ncbi:hypothetical protein XAB3213_4580006 [Xanthomonas citri pv. bilvae]|nr:hypothetical protein XAB3213_4580006 [Xanthomonas citri pv. bilvae]